MDKSNADSTYFIRRASEEQAAAERARDPRARQSHLDLAERYSDAARKGEIAPFADPDEAQLAMTPAISPEFRILP